MVLYHGTVAEFDAPSLEKCKPFRDFGRAFYLAADYCDAATMAIKNARNGYVYTYELLSTDGLEVFQFDGYSEQWVQYVVESRLNLPHNKQPNADLIIGNMAGGGANLKDKFARFRRLHTPVAEVVALMWKELTSTTLGIQYAFLTEKAIEQLRFCGSECVEKSCRSA